MNRANVHCVEKSTAWDLKSKAYIEYLDRQNVECPSGFLLARFQLVREGNFPAAKVRYLYRCCKLIM